MTLRRSARRALARIARHIPPRPGLYMFLWHDIGYGHPVIDDRLVVSPEQFEQEIDWIWRHFAVIDLPRTGDILDLGTLGPRDRLAVLTFDDGFRGVVDHAAPILGDLPFSVFVCRAAAHGFLLWPQMRTEVLRFAWLANSQRAWLLGLKAQWSAAYERELSRLHALLHLSRPTDAYLTVQECITLAERPGVTLGNHTAHHHILSRLADPGPEIEDGARFIRECGGDPSWLAIPHGEPQHMPKTLEVGVRPLLGVGGPHQRGEATIPIRRIVVSPRRPVWLATLLAGWGRR